MGVDVRHCLAVPDTFGAGEICGAIKDNPVQSGSRDCYFGSTPDLFSVDATLLSEDLGPVSFNFGFWIGIEVRNGKTCVWLGNEDYEICTKNCSTGNDLPSDTALASVAQEFVDEWAEENDIEGFQLLAGIIVAIIVLLIQALASAAGIGA